MMKIEKLIELLQETTQNSALHRTIKMIDWDCEWQDRDGTMHYQYTDIDDNDCILSIDSKGNASVTAYVYDDAVDYVRKYTTQIRSEKVVAMAG